MQSRYYDAEVGRFINGDSAEYVAIEQEILVHNLFSYCGNDCVNLSDSTGKSWLNSLWKGIKKGVSSAWDWIKKKAKNLAVFFKDTVCQKWIKEDFWNNFCKKKVWEKFSKEMVYNTFIKKWVWKTFCKEWIAKKAWTWINANKRYQVLSKTVLMGLIGFGIGVAITGISIGALAAAILSMVVTFIWEILSQGWNT